MVKHVDDKCIFDASWADTVEGAVHKYPNDHSKNMASVDILSRQIDEDGNLVSKKMLRTHFRPNAVMQKVMSVLKMERRTHQTSLEINHLDPARKLFRLQSLNKTYFNAIRCFEVLEYTPDNENPATKTELAQFALIDMYAKDCNFALRWAVQTGESVFAQQYIKNSQNNRQGLRDVITALQVEWEGLARDVAKDIIGKGAVLGDEIMSKSAEIGQEIVHKTVEVSQDIVDKTVEVGVVVKSEGEQVVGKISETVEKVLQESRAAPPEQK